MPILSSWHVLDLKTIKYIIHVHLIMPTTFHPPTTIKTNFPHQSWYVCKFQGVVQASKNGNCSLKKYQNKTEIEVIFQTWFESVQSSDNEELHNWKLLTP